jgi:hypothetical protein
VVKAMVEQLIAWDLPAAGEMACLAKGITSITIGDLGWSKLFRCCASAALPSVARSVDADTLATLLACTILRGMPAAGPTWTACMAS